MQAHLSDRVGLIDSVTNLERLLPIKSGIIDAHDSGDNIIIAAVPGVRIRVYAIKFSCAADVIVTWKSGLSSGASALGVAETFKLGGGMSDSWFPGFFFRTVIGECLNLSLSGAVQVSGWINYIEE